MAVQHQRAHEHAQHTAVVMGATGVSQGNFLQEGGLDHSLEELPGGLERRSRQGVSSMCELGAAEGPLSSSAVGGEWRPSGSCCHEDSHEAVLSWCWVSRESSRGMSEP